MTTIEAQTLRCSLRQSCQNFSPIGANSVPVLCSIFSLVCLCMVEQSSCGLHRARFLSGCLASQECRTPYNSSHQLVQDLELPLPVCSSSAFTATQGQRGTQPGNLGSSYTDLLHWVMLHRAQADYSEHISPIWGSLPGTGTLSPDCFNSVSWTLHCIWMTGAESVGMSDPWIDQCGDAVTWPLSVSVCPYCSYCDLSFLGLGT
jgi:hypothetical protein